MATVVFKDLHKLVSQSQQQQNKSKELFEILQDKPFWIWDKQQHKLEGIKTNGKVILTNGKTENQCQSNDMMIPTAISLKPNNN